MTLPPLYSTKKAKYFDHYIPGNTRVTRKEKKGFFAPSPFPPAHGEPVEGSFPT